MIKYLPLIIIAIFCSCKDRIKEIGFEQKEPISIDVLHSNPIEVDNVENQMGEPILLKLKSQDTSFLIASIKKMLVYKSEYYILDDRFSCLSRFDSTGNLISSYGRVGLKNNEFSKITDFDIDSLNNSVIIFSTENNALYFYSLSGSFFKKKDLGIFGSQYCNLSDGGAIFYRNFSAGLKGKENNIVLVDSNGNLKGKAFPFDLKKSVIAWESTGFLRTSNKKIFFSQAFSDTVYEYKDNVFSPLYNIILASRNLSSMKENHMKLLSTGIILDSTTSFLCSQFFVNNEFVVFNYQQNKKIRTLIFNTKSKKMLRISPESTTDPLIAFFLTPIYLDMNDNLYCKFDKNQVQAVQKKDPFLFDKLNAQVKSIVDDKKNNNGAFILKIKLNSNILN